MKPVPKNINPGILKTVHRLRAYGYETIDSGDGQAHDFECDRDYPYVVIRLPDDRIVRKCHALMSAIAHDWATELGPIGNEDLPWIQGDYDPHTREAHITVANVTDAGMTDRVSMFLEIKGGIQ